MPASWTSLADLGITGIELDATPVDGDIDGQQVVAEGTFHYADGTEQERSSRSRSIPHSARRIPAGARSAGADTFVLNDLDCHDGTPALRDVIGDFLTDLDTHDRISALKDVIRDFLQKDSIDWDRGIIDEFESLVVSSLRPHESTPASFGIRTRRTTPTAVQADTNDSRGAEIMFALTGVHNPNETDFIL